MQLGGGGGVTLVGSDRGVRARVIGYGQQPRHGNTLAADGPFAAWPARQRRLPRRSARSTTPSASPPTAAWPTTRCTCWSPPPPDEALARLVSARNITLVLTALLSLTAVVGAGLLVLNLRRLERTAALRESEAKAQSANQARPSSWPPSRELRTLLTSIRGLS